jgi:putative ABC transport system permease protein
MERTLMWLRINPIRTALHTWMVLGVRNILKNKRRSAFTMAAIAFGFTAINSLGGFTSYVFRGLEDSYVYALGNGHLSIYRAGFLSEGALSPEEFLLEHEDLELIQELFGDDPRIALMTPAMTVSGLVSNGEASAIMTAEGRVPSATEKIRSRGRGDIGSMPMFEGRPLADDQTNAIGIAKGLAAKLSLQQGSSVIVLAPTVDGYMNALDAEVVQMVDAPVEILDELMMVVPLSFARSLYDTRAADRLTVLLEEPTAIRAMRDEMSNRITEAGLEVDIRTWEELRPSYLRIRGMFTVIFSFVFLVVFVIVGMSVVNTIATAVLERTREIGTLRALGLRRRGTVAIFATESALLALVGSCIGIVMTFGVWAFVNLSNFTWTPPNIPKRVPLEIHLVPPFLIVTLIALVVLSVVAAGFPARRASRMSITDALGHV